MDSIIDMFFLSYVLNSGFTEKVKSSREGTMEFALKGYYGEGNYLVKPVGKSIAVGVTDFSYRQPFDLVLEEPEYFHIGLWRGSLWQGGRQGIIGQTGKKEMNRQHVPAGFHHCSMGISFLPDFFDTFLGSRHGISRDELERAIAALDHFPPPPDAALILKKIGEGASSGGAGNAWFEAKTLELVSLLLDWHRHLETMAPPQLRKQDQEGIAEALRYAGEHLAEPIPLETLAKLAAMSISKFTAAFKRHTGLSAATYINRFRMEKAADMLKNTLVPIGEIAAMVGYKHHASFSAAFQEQFGIIPSAFRKKDDREKNTNSKKY
jgi:AraC-like DNA-binding protein